MTADCTYGLGPNKAVPTRTMVEPSAIAASKSPLMPIESVSSPAPPRVELLAQRAQLREPGALARRLALFGRHAHQATQLQARQRAPPRRPAPAARAGVTPPLLASPPRLTCRHTFSGGAWNGRCAARRSAIFSRSSACTQANCSATGRVLLACSRPTKCQVSAAPAAPQFLPAPPAGNSRRSRQCPDRPPWPALSGGWALPTARSVTECAFRPAAAGGPCHAFANCGECGSAKFCGLINILDV